MQSTVPARLSITLLHTEGVGLGAGGGSEAKRAGARRASGEALPGGRPALARSLSSRRSALAAKCLEGEQAGRQKPEPAAPVPAGHRATLGTITSIQGCCGLPGPERRGSPPLEGHTTSCVSQGPGGQRLSTGVCTSQATGELRPVSGPPAAGTPPTLHPWAGGCRPGALRELRSSQGPKLRAAKMGRLRKAGLTKGS